MEDRRGARAPSRGSGGGAAALQLLPVLVRTLGWKGTLLLGVLVLGTLLCTGTLDDVLGVGGLPAGDGQGAVVQSAEEEALVRFVRVVLADTEDTRRELFQAQGEAYEDPVLVLFRGSVSSACGLGQAAMGPFYCPADHKVYLDLGFFQELRDRFRAPGDFAAAYVIAHEVGHHVQTLTGVSARVAQQGRGLGEVARNRLSVRQELQADCYAGVWAHHAEASRDLLEDGDVQEGLAAATAIGDDQLQREATGRIRPDAFTHGTSAQRVEWFQRGLATGDVAACDTFAAADLP